MLNKEPGIYKDLDIEEYHQNDGYLSSSRLKPMFESLRAFFTSRPDTEKKSYFDVGNSFEIALLEPENFQAKVAVFDDNKRPEPNKTYGAKVNKEWKEHFYLVNADKYVISLSDFHLIETMVQDCKKNKRISDILKGAQMQDSFYWEHETGIRLKSRPDLWKPVGTNKEIIIVDVKSAADGSAEGFAKQSQKLHYPWQAITQIEAMKSFGYDVVAYYWLVCEKNPVNPYSQLYRFNPRHIEIMGEVFEKKMISLQKAYERGERNLWWYTNRDADSVPYLDLNYYYFTNIDED